uniref:EGF-like domain-containing protein n=2 Tax=Dendroctonus ponderosae TaxID=77166 RepID=A0AAR5PB67_DENPD
MNPCDKGWYGIGCREKCPEMSIGNRTCDHITGEYVCPPGYLGLTCDHPCPINTYGKGCLQNCSCKNGGDCHHVTGECQCLPGWIGPTCASPCQPGSFGMNCTQHCKCQNGGECRRNDGVCRCKSGWTGTQCTEICPEGYYGDHCMQPCECKNDNFMCHPAEGCMCKHGYSGENCEESNILQLLKEKEPGNTGVIVAVIMVSAVFVAVVLLLIFYYKRRVTNLKTEIAHVQYIADPSGFSPDRNHFDNPVYTYQAPIKRSNEVLLNNGNRIINNLHKPGNANLDRAKISMAACCSTDDEEYVPKGAYGTNLEELRMLKNRDADATNPNIYHSVDHVYDEIKQKDIKDMELEYDHLDYTRPVSTLKPHYQRMSSPFGSRDLDRGSSKSINKSDTDD